MDSVQQDSSTSISINFPPIPTRIHAFSSYDKLPLLLPSFPPTASFNARFLNNIPLEWKREMIAHDRIRVDFSSNEEMIRAISRVDEIIDGLKMSSAYKLGYYTQTTTTATTSCGRTLPPGKRAEEPKPRWKEDSSSKYSRKTVRPWPISLLH